MYAQVLYCFTTVTSIYYDFIHTSTFGHVGICKVLIYDTFSNGLYTAKWYTCCSLYS